MSDYINIDHTEAKIDSSLTPKSESERTISPLAYIFMWIGDGVNLGNMTLGASLVVAGIAMMNFVQTMVAAAVAIAIISVIFALNDRFSYRTGVPYVVQLRMSFGIQGSIISSLMRGVPAVVWYGFQSWIGGTALNEIVKVVTGGSFDNVFICFLALQFLQIVLSLYGFHAIKWVETLVSVVIMCALAYAFYILVSDAGYKQKIMSTWFDAKGTWGIEFWGFIMAFMGNYAAIFLSAGDYSRELKSGISDTKRGFLYFLPIMIAYGAVLTIGVMLASATGITNPAKAFPIIVNNDYITVVVSAFIVLGAVGVNMVANIVAPAYVITLLTKLKYKPAVIITGLLAIASFPWLLVQDDSAKGLQLFIHIYSAFLGPIVAILLLEYYIFRKQKIDVKELYNTKGMFSGVNKTAIIAMLFGAAIAFINVNLTWILGFFAAGIAYILLTKFANLDPEFKKGTIFEKK